MKEPKRPVRVGVFEDVSNVRRAIAELQAAGAELDTTAGVGHHENAGRPAPGAAAG